MQVIHIAVARHIRECGDVGGYGNPVFGNGVDLVYLEPDIVCRTGNAAGGGVAADLLVLVAVGVGGGRCGVADIEALYARFGQREEFACFGGAVAVGVFPDF